VFSVVSEKMTTEYTEQEPKAQKKMIEGDLAYAQLLYFVLVRVIRGSAC
jgi:hypothetical protein